MTHTFTAREVDSPLSFAVKHNARVTGNPSFLKNNKDQVKSRLSWGWVVTGSRFERTRSVDTQGPRFPKSASIARREANIRMSLKTRQKAREVLTERQHEEADADADTAVAAPATEDDDDNAVVVSRKPSMSSSLDMDRLLAKAEERKTEEQQARNALEALEEQRVQHAGQPAQAAASSKFDYDKINALTKASQAQMESAQKLLARNGPVKKSTHTFPDSPPALRRRDSGVAGSDTATVADLGDASTLADLLSAERAAHAKTKQQLRQMEAKAQSALRKHQEAQESLKRTNIDLAYKSTVLANMKKRDVATEVVGLRAQLVEEQRKYRAIQAELRNEARLRTRLHEQNKDAEAKLRFWKDQAASGGKLVRSPTRDKMGGTAKSGSSPPGVTLPPVT
eukprot:m.218911 g.218911  ORF g.218911 m.218911 type:complete len:396 (-) comp18690_c0_seq10:99-1286(-)